MVYSYQTMNAFFEKEKNMFIIQEILGYFFIALVGLLILTIFYLPVYFLLRKRIPVSRQIAGFLFVVCILVISEATVFGTIMINLISGTGIFSQNHYYNIIPFQFLFKVWEMGMRKQITQELANVIMFVPLGFIFPVACKKVRKFWIASACMAFFSFLIEFSQYFIGRAADIDDLILNTLGGMFGYFVFYVCTRLFQDKKIWKQFTMSAIM